MRSLAATGDTRLLFWQRVREFAVPPSMIESATARRSAGDWAGACAAAHVDVDLDLRGITRAHGREVAAAVRADLRGLAPDLLRWHMPRTAPDGLLRPGLTMALACYGNTVRLVARTPPSWADAGQRIEVTLWDRKSPQPHPDRRFRLDLHRHLWDAECSGALRERAGAGGGNVSWDPEGLVPKGIGCAVDRWPSEAAIVLRSHGHDSGTVAVRLGSRRRLLLRVDHQDGVRAIAAPAKGNPAWPELPDAATWVLPDLALLQNGLIAMGQLHPLVAAAFGPGGSAPRAEAGHDRARLVECRGAVHRIGLVDGVLVPLDHDRTEIRREAVLAALGGRPLPCLNAIDGIHRRPDELTQIRARLDHGDFAGALAAVEALLGRDAVLRDGALREELETAAQRRIVHGLYRAGLIGRGPFRSAGDTRRHRMSRKGGDRNA